MLYEITQLKAPWPVDAKVGDVINMPVLPGWAVGKCRTATDAKKATVEFVEPAPARDIASELATAEAALAKFESDALKASDEHATALDAMTKRAEAAEAALAKAKQK